MNEEIKYHWFLLSYTYTTLLNSEYYQYFGHINFNSDVKELPFKVTEKLIKHILNTTTHVELSSKDITILNICYRGYMSEQIFNEN